MNSNLEITTPNKFAKINIREQGEFVNIKILFCK